MSTVLIKCLSFAMLGVTGFGLGHLQKRLSLTAFVALVAVTTTLVGALKPVLLVPAVIGCLIGQKRASYVTARRKAKVKHADDVMLDKLQLAHFQYFQENSHPTTGLTLDRSQTGAPASIAATGFALTAFPIAVERNWISRDEAAAHALKVVRTLWGTLQGEDPATTSGKFGFYFHFMHWD